MTRNGRVRADVASSLVIRPLQVTSESESRREHTVCISMRWNWGGQGYSLFSQLAGSIRIFENISSPSTLIIS
jgi:hypothetical protein